MARHGIARLADIIGSLDTTQEGTGVDQLLVALDVETGAKALALADVAARRRRRFKIGSRLFTAEGPAIVRRARRRGRSRLPRSQVPRHPEHRRRRRSRPRRRSACGWSTCTRRAGRAMMRAARDAAHDTAARTGPDAAAGDRRHGAHQHEPAAALPKRGSPATVLDQVLRLRELAQDAGLDGVVASPQETATIRRALRRRTSRS